MTLAAVRRLLAHMQWADREVWRALQQAPGRHGERALELYGHVLGAEHVWLARLEQRRPTVAVWPRLDPDGCRLLMEENGAAWEVFVGRTSETGLAELVPYLNSAGQSFRSSVGDILLHVFLHGAYHRGQVALLLRDGGGTPAPTDFIGFVRGVPSATRVS